MKKNFTYIILAIIAVSGLTIGTAYAYHFLQNKSNLSVQPLDSKSEVKTTSLIGGQRDEHGCLVPAGFSWCEATQKCLRTWEEACSAEGALKNYLQVNLSALSPQKEVLGGKFYITDLKVISPTLAEVGFEDGHIALRAQFNYRFENGKVIVENFKLLPEAPSPKDNRNSTTTPPSKTIQLTFQPVQCEQEPWKAWYAEGHINFFKAPTDEELIKAYYGQKHSINILSASRKDSGTMTCEACSVCKTSYYYTASVSLQDAAKLQDLGWKQ